MYSDIEIDMEASRSLCKQDENITKKTKASFSFNASRNRIPTRSFAQEICGEPINEFAKLMCAPEIIKNRLRSSSHRRHSTMPDFSCVLTFHVANLREIKSDRC